MYGHGHVLHLAALHLFRQAHTQFGTSPVTLRPRTGRPTDASRAWILDRCRAGAQFTVDVWYAAWKRSEKLPAHY